VGSTPSWQVEQLDVFRVIRPRPIGVLRVTLQEATGLRAADMTFLGPLLSGKSDPYVKLRLGSQEWRSKTISKTLKPKWTDAETDFLINVYEDQELCIDVYDEDMASKDDFLGGKVVGVASLVVMNDMWLELEDEDDPSPCGKIRFTVEYYPLRLAPDRLRSIMPEQPKFTCMLFVGIYDGKALPSIPIGSAYWVNLTLTGKEKQVKETTKVQRVKDKAFQTEEKSACKIAASCVKLHEAGVENALIAEVFDCPLDSVVEYLEFKAKNVKDKNNKQALEDFADDEYHLGAPVDIQFEQAFEFLVRDPHSEELSFQVMHTHKKKGKNVGDLLKVKVSDLIDEPSNTKLEKLKLGCPRYKDAQLIVKYELRIMAK